MVGLVLCVVGSRVFGRATVLVLASVLACTGLTVASFFRDVELEENFVFNATDPAQCVAPVSPDNSTDVTPNCTKSTVGHFVGFAAATGEGICISDVA